MTWLILAFCALLSLAAGESPYGDRYSGGRIPGYGGTTGGGGGIMGGYGGPSGTTGGMAWSGSPQQGTSGGPFVTTTTVTTVLDLSTGITKTFHSSSNRGSDKFNYGDENRMREEGGGGNHAFLNVLSENDINMLNSSWHVLRKRSDFAPKVFMRYFKAKPEAQKLFPEFANVPLNDLPNNHDFLNVAYSCVASLDYILPHLKYAHPERCPALLELKNKYSDADIKKFGPIWMMAMQEEMGNALTNEVRDVWKKAFVAFSEYASH